MILHFEFRIANCEFWRTPINLPFQKSLLAQKTTSQFAEPVIPDESASGGRDPWFDRLTTLSEVEGESSKGSIESDYC
jgi:hypothetical protein